MKTTEWDNTFPHFAPEEYFSPEGLLIFQQKNIIPCDLMVLGYLESLRYQLNFNRNEGFIPCSEEIYITINTKANNLRGFVTPGEWTAKRSKEEGQLFSFHLWCAVDILSNVPPSVLFHYAKLSNFTGIIKYHWGVHLDCRMSEQYIRERL